ncbi:luciferin 4-monooxygenase-like [Monomorium pharaonis]|uniref:luciferin 4-monooxygenase-like n=1 Tax=Monomorium pharaonis TaxID=307658 RepID=UPI001745CB7B|nr:luciferin 4-monooxygenase-like [Monomorium pharaonis]XP_036139947.1 luciferin 4-monooxygenase-like [Monomorium pharaonis]
MCEPNSTTNKNEVQASRFKNIKDNILLGPEYPIHKESVNIAETILKTLKSKPDFIGQIDALTDKKNTYAEMSERSIKCALWLKKQGVKAGDIIGLCTDNNLDAIMVLLGVMYLNGKCNTWDHELSLITARYFLSLTSPKIIFTIPLSAGNLTEAAKELKMDVKIVVLGKLDGYESLDDILRGHNSREIAEFTCTPISNPDEVCLIVLSSGTTGMPKATELSHFFMHNRLFPAKVDEMNGHICLFTPTLRWLYGIMLAFNAILEYFTRIVAPDCVTDDAEDACTKYCSFIKKYRVTIFATDPFILIQFVKTDVLEKYQLPTLKVIISAGAVFSKQQQEALTKKIPHVLIFNDYGSTDSGGPIAGQNKYSKPGSVGFPAHNVQIKITDTKTESVLEVNKIGEIRIKAPFVMIGYYKNPEATKKTFDSDGWLCTGDLGYYDNDGELFVVGRISDFILFRSINVSPTEIETVLQNHPAVFEAAVIGMPHEIDGQRPMAVVSVVPGKTVTEQELIEFVEKSLPDHCRLRAGVKFIDKLPRTLTGKIVKKQLQSIFTNYYKLS